VVRCVHIPMDDIPVLLYSTWYDLLVYGTRFPMEHLTFLHYLVFLYCLNVDAFVHVSIYGYGSIAMNIHHVDMVLYIDTSTLLVHKPGVGKSTRSLCDIHAGFCSCLLLSVSLFPFSIYLLYL